MTSREIVKKALAFEGPERVPMSLPTPYPNDFQSASYKLKDSKATDWYEAGKRRWERIDEWGNKWSRIKNISKGEVSKGILENLDDVERIELPHLDDYDNAQHGDHVVIQGNEVMKDDDDIFGSKHINVERTIIQTFLNEIDPTASMILLKNELTRIYQLAETIADMIKNLKKNEKL